MTISLSLNKEKTLKLADFLGIDQSRITSGEITSLTVYGNLKEERSESEC